MSSPLLHSPRLDLVPFAKSDLNLLYILFTEPFVRKYLWDDQIIGLDQCREILTQNDAHFSEESWGLWKLNFKENKACIGFAGLWPFFGEKQPQLIYGLMQQFTGLGLATEAARSVVDYSFDSLKFTYLDAATDRGHTDSEKVAKRLGMKLLRESNMDGKPTLFFRLSAPPQA